MSLVAAVATALVVCLLLTRPSSVTRPPGRQRHRGSGVLVAVGLAGGGFLPRGCRGRTWSSS